MPIYSNHPSGGSTTLTEPAVSEISLSFENLQVGSIYKGAELIRVLAVHCAADLLKQVMFATLALYALGEPADHCPGVYISSWAPICATFERVLVSLFI